MEVVREYSDFGRSGLKIDGREALNQLMADVENKRTDFSALLRLLHMCFAAIRFAWSMTCCSF
jgi:hypothetical protein